MSGKAPAPQNGKNNQQITILLVDDIPETRESIKKLLAFEQDFRVIGTAGTGREGIELARQHEPDIIIMDINMPDMDGLQATSVIQKSVPMSAVIIMSVQNDADYMRRALRVGARDFLTKPVDMDELYNTIRTVYDETKEERARAKDRPEIDSFRSMDTENSSGEHAGHIIAVYSPKGGVGTTMVATNLASGLMKEGRKVLLIDGDLQFGDVGTFLFLQAQTTIVELAEDVDDLDIDLFENIVVTHDSGLKVLMGPPRPEFADEIRQDPTIMSRIIEQIAGNYDFIIVDTGKIFDEVLINVLEIASKIIMVGTPSLASVKHMRFVLDLFDQLGIESDKIMLVLNRVYDERKDRGINVSTEKIQNFLKHEIVAKIPVVDERIILSAMNKGVPVIASDRDQNKAPIRQLLELSDFVYHQMMGLEEEEEESDEAVNEAQQSSRFGLLRRR